MTYTFTNLDADGDLSNPDNWDVGGSPAGQVPTSGDTAVLDGQTVSAGTCAAAVSSAASAQLNGGTLSGAVNVTAAVFNGIACALSVNVNDCSIVVDPGNGITSTAGCNFSGSFTSAITDTGGYFNNETTYAAPVVSTGGYVDAGATFNSTVTATGCTVYGGTFNGADSQFTGCTISGGTFNTGISVTGGDITAGAVFENDITFTGLTFDTAFTGSVGSGAVCVSCNIEAGTFADVTCSGDISITGGSFASITVSSATSLIIGPSVALAGSAGLLNIDVPIADYPAAANVYLGTTYASGTRTGTLTLPTSIQVENAITYGIGGNSLTGVMVIPATTDVRNGVNVGISHGSLVVPAAAQVQAGVTFDNGTVGTYAVSGSRVGCSMITRQA